MEGDFYGKGASTYRGACGGRAARPADRGRAAPSQPAAQSPHVHSYHLIGRGCCSTLPPAVSEVLLPPRCTYTHKGGCPTLPLDKTHSQVVEAVKFVLMVQFQLSFRRKCENLNDLVVIILFSSSSSSSSGGGGGNSSSSSSSSSSTSSSSSSSNSVSSNYIICIYKGNNSIIIIIIIIMTMCRDQVLESIHDNLFLVREQKTLESYYLHLAEPPTSSPASLSSLQPGLRHPR